MRKRLTQICTPLLIILVMAWGTCPCFYAEILTGGLVSFDASPEGTCTCGRDAADQAGATGPVATADKSTENDRCPCLDTIGTMHELPHADEPVLCAGDEILLVQEPLTLRPTAFAPEDRGLPMGADPGPTLQSVVLLV